MAAIYFENIKSTNEIVLVIVHSEGSSRVEIHPAELRKMITRANIALSQHQKREQKNK